jgi:hypothetical protein
MITLVSPLEEEHLVGKFCDLFRLMVYLSLPDSVNPWDTLDGPPEEVVAQESVGLV